MDMASMIGEVSIEQPESASEAAGKSFRCRYSKTQWLRIALWAMIAAFCVLRYCRLTADFPNDSPWMIDQAKFTDEGWWSSAAVMQSVTGHWLVAGDYNPAVALPVWPILLTVLF